MNKEQILAAMQSIIDNAGDTLSESEQKRFDALKVLAAESDIDIQNGLNAPARGFPVQRRKSQPGAEILTDPTAGPHSQQNRFSQSRPAPGLQCFSSRKKAEAFGHYLFASLGNMVSMKWLDTNGFSFEALHQEGVNTSGGYLVPDEMSNDIIRLVELYGVFRQNAYYRTMKSETLKVPRRTGGLSSYFIGEGSQITESTMTIDAVQLTAKKLGVLTRATGELIEDSESIIAFADFVAMEIAQAFAEKEDLCGFTGDGSSDFGGIVGIIPQLSTINGVDDGGGLVLAAGNLYTDITLANLCKLVSLCPRYARANAKWYCSSVFYGQVMLKLLTAAGGVNGRELVDGVTEERFLGFPLEFAEVLPSAEANSQICCLFGNLQQASAFGDRRAISIDSTNSAVVDGESTFERDQIAFRGLERFDIAAHDLGTATTSGPVVGLITAAS